MQWYSGWDFLSINPGVWEVGEGLDETRLAMSWQLLKLACGFTGAHYTSLSSSVYIFRRRKIQGSVN